MERTAIFPGSFDPFTRGHAALVDEALNLFDRVVIGIGNNTSKQGLLTVETASGSSTTSTAAMSASKRASTPG